MKVFVTLLAVVAVVAANPLPLVQIIVNVDAPSSVVGADVGMPVDIIDRPMPDAWPADKPEPVEEEPIPEPIELPAPIFPTPIVVPDPDIVDEPGIIMPSPIVQQPDILEPNPEIAN